MKLQQTDTVWQQSHTQSAAKYEGSHLVQQAPQLLKQGYRKYNFTITCSLWSV